MFPQIISGMQLNIIMKTVFKILRMILDVFLVAAVLLIFMVNGIAKKEYQRT